MNTSQTIKTAILWFVSFCMIASCLWGKTAQLLPLPQEISLDTNASRFRLHRSVHLISDSANFELERFIKQHCRRKGKARGRIVVKFVQEIDGAGETPLWGYSPEAYSLSVTADKVIIRAVSNTGVTRAAQTLSQLAEGWDDEEPQLEACSITDWPAFPLRGFMHDVGRSFISVDELLHQLDLLSRFKVNTFHFHLTENQAWRFQVKAYPQLTDSLSMTRFPGKFYTQEQCAYIERYARERGIIVIPEIDMPGHSQAFERAMGHGMQTAEGKRELLNILREVAETFPLAPYIHIGADEQTITDSTFLPSMAEAVRQSGKRVVVWNPIRGVNLSGQNFCDMTQMWSTAGKAVSGVPNIDCRYNYINHFDVFADVVGIYKSNIYYQPQANSEVAGAITAVWNDRLLPSEADITLQNNLYAAVLASAERAWRGGGERYIEQGGVMLPPSETVEFQEFADWERRFLFHKAHSLSKEPIPYVKQTNVHWLITDAFPNGGDPAALLPPDSLGPQPSYTLAGETYGTRPATGAAIYLCHTWGSIVPAFFSNPQLGTTAYAWTYIYSPVAQTAGALVEFQNYSRSEADPAPWPSCWDRKGSRLWLNDEEILPPQWLGNAGSSDREQPLLNENFPARPPIKVTLRQGWNKVFLKLPYVPAPGIRLNKWMFTFVLTTPDGRDALPNVLYSPTMEMVR
ncbi:MAG: beta-N-acetylhexosaminidase, partial [Prevotellaceae bacterium]|nr:beta-N-acetylhexosaminidase [Prevotellaceae bacterium]